MMRNHIVANQEGNALALSTSIAGIVCTITLFISLRKKIGHIRLKYIVVSEMKILLSSLVMGLCAKQSFLYLTLKVSEFLSLFVSVFIGALVYVIIMYFMKIDEVNSILSMFKNKINFISIKNIYQIIFFLNLKILPK